MNHRLNCEQLEARDTPAGLVTAFVAGDTLFVLGDGHPAGNQVQVAQDGFGNLFVTGLGGTAVNGQFGVYVGTGVPARVSIQLGGFGPDYAEVVGLTAGVVDVFTGAGDDGVAMYGVAAGWATIDLGGRNDWVDVRYVSTQAGLYVDGGPRFDTALLGPVAGPAYFQGFERAFLVF